LTGKALIRRNFDNISQFASGGDPQRKLQAWGGLAGRFTGCFTGISSPTFNYMYSILIHAEHLYCGTPTGALAATLPDPLRPANKTRPTPTE